MYKNNSRDSSKFKSFSPLQLLYNLTGNRPQSATILTYYTNVTWKFCKKQVNCV